MLLAIDPGTVTGVAWDVDGHVEYATWQLGMDTDKRLLRLADNLTDILGNHACRHLAYEEPYVGPFKNAAESLFAQRGIIRYIAARMCIPAHGYSPREIKMGIAGGKATKDQMIDAIKARGYSPANEHEADAIALLLLMRTGTLPMEGTRKAAVRQQRKKVVDLFSKSTVRRITKKTRSNAKIA